MTYKLKRRKQPVGRVRCLPPGATKPAQVLTRALTAALLLGALLAGPAQAAPNWLPPVTLTGEGLDEAEMVVAVAPDGTTVAAWSRREGSGDVVEAVRRAPGQAFGAPTTLSETGNGATAPQVAMDGGGNATVAWEEDLPAGERIRVARLAAGASGFEPSQTLVSMDDAAAPAVGVGANGTAVVAFQEGTFGSRVLKAAIRDGAGSLFGIPQTISDPSGNFYATNGTASADVAVAPDGSAVVAWATFITADSRYLVQTNTRAPNGVFAATGRTRSSTAANASGEHPALAMDAQGNATVAWTHIPDNTGPAAREVRFSKRPAGGGFAPAQTAGDPAPVVENPDLATGPDGSVIGAWLSGSGASTPGRDGDPGARLERLRHASAPLARHRPVARPALGRRPGRRRRRDLAGADIGALVAARRLPGGAFGDVKEVVERRGRAGRHAVPVHDAHDRRRRPGQRHGAVAVRPLPLGHALLPRPGRRLRRRPADAGGERARPRPSRARRLGWPRRRSTAGARSRCTGRSATARPARATRWLHAFGNAGAFNVTVTATDAAGNASSATRPIAVAAPPPRRIDSSVSSRWGFDRRKRFIFLLQLRVKAPPQGAVAELRCKGRKCPFKRKRVTRIRRNRIDVFKALSKRQRRFRPRQTLQLRITAPNHIGKVVRFRLRRGKIPNGQTLCLPPGATRPQKTC